MNSCLSCAEPCQDSLCASCLHDREVFPSIYTEIVQQEQTLLAELVRERNTVSPEFRVKPGTRVRISKKGEEALLAYKMGALIDGIHQAIERRREKRRKLMRAWRSPIIGA